MTKCSETSVTKKIKQVDEAIQKAVVLEKVIEELARRVNVIYEYIQAVSQQQASQQELSDASSIN